MPTASKKLQTTIRSWPNGTHYLPLDSETADRFLSAGHKRLLCTIGAAEPFHCAILSSREEGPYIYLGAPLRKKLGLRSGMTVTAKLQADASEHGAPMPEELHEVLQTDPEAGAVFNRLTPGNRRSLIHYVLGVKSTDKRIERSLLIASRLKAGITSVREMRP